MNKVGGYVRKEAILWINTRVSSDMVSAYASYFAADHEVQSHQMIYASVGKNKYVYSLSKEEIEEIMQ